MKSSEAILGMALREPTALAVAADVGVTLAMFDDPFHASLWSAMLACERRGQPFDIVAMGMEFPLEASQIVGLSEEAPRSNVAFYARRLVNERWLSSAVARFADLAKTGQGLSPTDEALDAFRATVAACVADLERTAGASGLVAALPSVKAALVELEASIVAQQAGQAIGITTGFPGLDRILGAGWRRGSMTALCARSGKGKTTFALNSFSAAIAAGFRSLFFTVEMPNSELTTKLLARDGRIWGARLLNGQPTDEEIDRLHHVAGQIAEGKWSIDDNFAGSVDTLCQRVRSYHRIHGLDVVFVDYAQQLIGPNQRASRREHIEYATARLKQLAIQVKVAIVLIAQVNRLADEEDEIPGPHLIADSAAPEKDSDAVLMLHHYEDGRSIVQVAKNRHGQSGIGYAIVCDWNTGTFSERPPQPYAGRPDGKRK